MSDIRTSTYIRTSAIIETMEINRNIEKLCRGFDTMSDLDLRHIPQKLWYIIFQHLSFDKMLTIGGDFDKQCSSLALTCARRYQSDEFGNFVQYANLEFMRKVTIQTIHTTMQCTELGEREIAYYLDKMDVVLNTSNGFELEKLLTGMTTTSPGVKKRVNELSRLFSHTIECKIKLLLFSNKPGVAESNTLGYAEFTKFFYMDYSGLDRPNGCGNAANGLLFRALSSNYLLNHTNINPNHPFCMIFTLMGFFHGGGVHLQRCLTLVKLMLNRKISRTTGLYNVTSIFSNWYILFLLIYANSKFTSNSDSNCYNVIFKNRDDRKFTSDDIVNLLEIINFECPFEKRTMRDYSKYITSSFDTDESKMTLSLFYMTTLYNLIKVELLRLSSVGDIVVRYVTSSCSPDDSCVYLVEKDGNYKLATQTIAQMLFSRYPDLVGFLSHVNPDGKMPGMDMRVWNRFERPTLESLFNCIASGFGYDKTVEFHCRKQTDGGTLKTKHNCLQILVQHLRDVLLSVCQNQSESEGGLVMVPLNPFFMYDLESSFPKGVNSKFNGGKMKMSIRIDQQICKIRDQLGYDNKRKIGLTTYIDAIWGDDKLKWIKNNASNMNAYTLRNYSKNTFEFLSNCTRCKSTITGDCGDDVVGIDDNSIIVDLSNIDETWLDSKFPSIEIVQTDHGPSCRIDMLTILEFLMDIFLCDGLTYNDRFRHLFDVQRNNNEKLKQVQVESNCCGIFSKLNSDYVTNQCSESNFKKRNASTCDDNNDNERCNNVDSNFEDISGDDVDKQMGFMDIDLCDYKKMFGQFPDALQCIILDGYCSYRWMKLCYMQFLQYCLNLIDPDLCTSISFDCVNEKFEEKVYRLLKVGMFHKYSIYKSKFRRASGRQGQIEFTITNVSNLSPILCTFFFESK